jgi:hypothetical protein
MVIIGAAPPMTIAAPANREPFFPIPGHHCVRVLGSGVRFDAVEKRIVFVLRSSFETSRGEFECGYLFCFC